MTTNQKIFLALGLLALAATGGILIYNSQNKTSVPPANTNAGSSAPNTPPPAQPVAKPTNDDFTILVKLAKQANADWFTSMSLPQMALLQASYIANLNADEAKTLNSLVARGQANWSPADKDMFSHLWQKVTGKTVKF